MKSVELSSGLNGDSLEGWDEARELGKDEENPRAGRASVDEGGETKKESGDERKSGWLRKSSQPVIIG